MVQSIRSIQCRKITKRYRKRDQAIWALNGFWHVTSETLDRGLEACSLTATTPDSSWGGLKLYCKLPLTASAHAVVSNTDTLGRRSTVRVRIKMSTNTYQSYEPVSKQQMSPSQSIYVSATV